MPLGISRRITSAHLGDPVLAETVLIAAGGTGGHLFPAEALAHALAARGYAIHLVTDHRAVGYGGAFPADETHIVASATLAGKDPASALRFLYRLGKGYAQSRAIVKKVKPVAAIGFGGYPTVPPLLAAAHLGVPAIVHESNAVMGRANRFLARKMSVVATTYPHTTFLDAGINSEMTGNPVRPRVRAAAEYPWAEPQADGTLRLLVFGGSQGARVFADLVPPAMEALDPALRSRLFLVQQARQEDVERVTAVYGRLGLAHEVKPFFTDLPEHIAAAHLVVSRSGAGTCAELAVIGRPSILVPLPHALDNDQKTNALELQKAGAAIMAEQAGLDAATLARHLESLLAQPARLTAMAAAARGIGQPDAVEKLADLVVSQSRIFKSRLPKSKNRTKTP